MPLALALAAPLLAAAVAMTQPADLRPRLAAFPRIAAPTTPAQRQVNVAVARLDGRALRAVAACRRDAGPMGASWERAVATTMRGPDFVSYLITDDVYCGGAHPNNSHAAIVYDLARGAPVDWPTLLSPRLAGTLALSEGPDGVMTVTLASPRLFALYAAGYDAALTAAGGIEECRGLLGADGDGPRPLQAWLDGPRGALVLQFDLNHAMQACSTPVSIPAEVLRREGASAQLVTALLAARRDSSAR